MKHTTKQGTIKRWLLSLLGILAFVLVCLQSLLFFFGDEILKKSILVAFRQYHAYRFPDSYVQSSLDFENLKFNLLAGELTVTHLELRNIPIMEQHELQGITTLTAEQLTVRGIHLWEIYRRQELNLKRVQLLQPSISTLKKKSMPVEQPDASTWIKKNTRRLFVAVTPFCKKISFEHFQIDDANISVHITDSLQHGKAGENTLKQFYAQHMYVSLTDFLLDSLRLYDTTRILFARHLDLKISSYGFMLTDSSYYLKADTLAFSTQDQKLQLKNVLLLPQKGKKENEKQYVHARVPELELTNINLQQIYFDSLLQINDLTLHRPYIQWYGSFSRKESGQSSAPGLQYLHPDTLKLLLSDKLKRFGVHTFRLHHARLDVFDIHNDSSTLLGVENFDVAISDLSLDHKKVNESVSLSQALPVESILLDIQNLKIRMPDKAHKLLSRSVVLKANRLNSYLCNLSIKGFQLQPLPDSLAQHTHGTSSFNLSVPEAELYGINLQDLSLHRLLTIDSMFFSRPALYIDQKERGAVADASARQNKNKELANIPDSRHEWDLFNVNLHPAIAPGSATALLHGIHVDYVRIDSGTLQLQQLNHGTQRKMAAIGNISATFRKVRLDEAAGDMGYKHKSVANRSLALYADEAEVNLQEAAFWLPSRGHPASAAFVRFNQAMLSTSGSEIKVHGLHIRPAAGVSSKSQLQECTIPYLEIAGLDFERLYKKRQALADVILLSAPEITMAFDERQQEKSHTEASLQQLYQWMRPYLQVVSLKKLEVTNAALAIKKRKRGEKVFRKYAGAVSVDISLENFYLDSLSRISRKKPFYAERLLLQANGIYASLKGSNSVNPVEIQAKSLLFSTDTRRLQLKQLRLSSQHKAADMLYSFVVDSISAEYGNLDEYLKYDELLLRELYILHPRGEFALHVSEQPPLLPQEKKKLLPDLYAFVQEIITKLRINTLNIERGALSYLTYQQDTISHIEIKSASLAAENIWIEDGRQSPAEKMDLTLALQSCHARLKQSQSQFSASEVHLSYQKAQLSVKELKVAAFPARSDGIPATFMTTVPLMEMNRMDFNKAYRDGDWVVGEVLILDPVWEASLSTDSQAAEPVPRQLFGSFISSVAIGQAHLKNGKLHLVQADAGYEKSITVHHIDAEMKDFYIDQQLWEKKQGRENQNANPSRDLFFAEELEISGKDYQQILKDSLLLLKAEAFTFNTKQSALWVAALQLQPLHSRQQVIDVYPYQKTWIDCRIPMTRVESIALEKWWKEGSLSIGAVHLSSPYLNLYTDKRLPRNYEESKPMPQEILMKLGFPLTIDSVQVSNGFISYEEQAPDTDKSGVLTFEKVSASLKDITNDPGLIRVNTLMSLKANAYLLGKSLLEVNLNFHLGSPDQMFSASGNLGALDLTLLNVMLEPAASVFINKGMAHHLNFQFVGNRERSSGAMRFLYNDLHVLLIDRQTGALGLEERVGSFLANTFVLKADNPVGATLRIGKIAYERDQTRSIFHFVWKSVLSGMKSSIGMEKHGDKTKDLTIMED